MNKHSWITLSQSDPRALYLQVIEQIQRRVAVGDLPPGTELPSIRQLAADLSVSVITIKRAYLELERDATITTQHGKGSVVSENPGLSTTLAERELESHLNSAAELGEGRESAWLERTQSEGWPIYIPDKPEKIESDIVTQFVQIGIVLVIGIPMLLKYLLARGTYVAADDEAIRPSWRRDVIPFAAITKIDKTRWGPKGIAKLTYTQDGVERTFIMDDFKFARAEMAQIMARAERDLPENAIIGSRQNATPDPGTV